MGLFKSLAEGSVNNLIDTADFNKDGIADKEQLGAIGKELGEAAEDFEQSVDWVKAGKAFDEFCVNGQQLLSVLNPDLVKDNNVDVAQLFSELSLPANREAAGRAIKSLLVIAQAVNREEVHSAVKNLGEAKAKLEVFIKPTQPKSKKK